MPWRNLPPEWLEYLKGLLAFCWAAAVGAAARLAHEVKMGDREKFFSRALFLTAPSVIMSGMLAYGIADHFQLTLGQGMGLGSFAGAAGIRFADLLFSMLERRK